MATKWLLEALKSIAKVNLQEKQRMKSVKTLFSTNVFIMT